MRFDCIPPEFSPFNKKNIGKRSSFHGTSRDKNLRYRPTQFLNVVVNRSIAIKVAFDGKYYETGPRCINDYNSVFYLLLSSHSELTQIVAEVVADPTLPRTEDHPCERCGHRESVFFQSQTDRAEVMNLCLIFNFSM